MGSFGAPFPRNLNHWFMAYLLYKQLSVSNNARKRYAARTFCASSAAVGMRGDRLRAGLTNPNDIRRPTPSLHFAKAVLVGVATPDRG
jgi:hypothetical protein